MINLDLLSLSVTNLLGLQSKKNKLESECLIILIALVTKQMFQIMAPCID
jgi:hypothetical protein